VSGKTSTSRVAAKIGSSHRQAMNPKSFSFWHFQGTEEPTQ
jgi:hypothetical protein